MIGEWIEFNGKIYEITGETGTDYVCREVLYLSENPKLKYDKDITFIGKALI